MTSGKISVLSPGTHYYDYKISDFLLFNFVRSKEMCYIHDQKIDYDDTLSYENNQSPSQLHKISLCSGVYYWPKKTYSSGICQVLCNYTLKYGLK